MTASTNNYADLRSAAVIVVLSLSPSPSFLFSNFRSVSGHAGAIMMI